MPSLDISERTMALLRYLAAYEGGLSCEDYLGKLIEQVQKDGGISRQLVTAVAQHYQNVMAKGALWTLTPARRALIGRRAKEVSNLCWQSHSFDTDQEHRDRVQSTLCMAIDGCAASDFHMGKKPGQPQKYNSLELIFRSYEYMEKFINLAQEATT